MFSCLKNFAKSNVFLILKNTQVCHVNGQKRFSAVLEIASVRQFHTSKVNAFLGKRPSFEFGKRMLEDIEEIKKIEFSKELNLLKGEIKESLTFHNEELEFRDQRHTMDLLFTFEREEDLQNFIVSTDSSNDIGYSSASFETSPNGTAIFSGNLCTEIPKTGDVDRAGFVNVSSKKKFKAFGRKYFYDWTRYTHLVLRVRGDGRTYTILIYTPGEYNHEKYMSYNYPLYTRGGPYWQTTKIPFSHFYFSNVGRVVESQGWVMPRRQISRFGISLSDNIDGPFKLEIDYVGLEFSEHTNLISPYENYNVGRKFV